jgi:hypothetical protein
MQAGFWGRRALICRRVTRRLKTVGSRVSRVPTPNGQQLGERCLVSDLAADNERLLIELLR